MFVYAGVYSIINEEISACSILKVECSYMQASTVFGAIVLVLIILNEAISACGFLKVECSYMQASTIQQMKLFRRVSS